MIKKIAWLLVIMLLVATAIAQETTAGIQGTVKDTTGAVVSKAKVEVSGAAMIGVKKVETDASGYFRFANLPPGEYILTASADKFKTVKQAGIKLEVGKLPTIDIKMEVGGIEQVVEVTGAAPIVDVTQSKVQTNISSEVIDGIPKGRSFQSLIALAPGARQEPLQGGGYQIDGASNAENTYMVEGQDTGNIQTGSSAANVPFEFIQEVQIKSGGFEAEYGGALGGVVNVIQKRGGNAWHGSVFTYYRGDLFNAAPNRILRKVPGTSINYGSRTDRPDEYIQNKKDHFRIVEPGFEVGGYLKKDRLWLFSSFVPQIVRYRRTANWNFNPTVSAGVPNPVVPTVIGPRTFTQNEEIYNAISRVDFLATQKIRVYGAWQTQYDRLTGALPNADNVYGQSNTTATANPDNYNGSIGYVAPNLIYNTGADITITPNLISTTRFGYFYTNYENRGLPKGNLYQWRDVNYSYPAISTMSSTTGVVSVWTIHDNAAYTVANGYDPADPRLYPGCMATNTCAVSYSHSTTSGDLLGTQMDSKWARSSGFATIGSNYTTFFDKYWRKSLNQDVAYFKKGFLGTHNFKGGYALNKLSNDVFDKYNDGAVWMGYGRNFTAGNAPVNVAACAVINTYNNANFGTHLDTVAPGKCGGQYGTINLRDLQTTGQVASNNHALYLQDAWTPGYGVTMNLGIRFDKEALPNYYSSLAGFQGIKFGFGDKVAPRLGASWDVFRNGKLKAYGSFGYFFDIMKYEMPRGSFGGDYWHDCIYALDDPDYTKILPTRAQGLGTHQVFCNATGGANGAGFGIPAAGKPARANGGLIANVDFRSPSNDPADYRIDPNLKPMKQHEMTLGADWAINPKLGLETRYTRKRLDTTIEDAGYLDQYGNERFYIINPGEGIHQKYGLVPTTDCYDSVTKSECGSQPKAVRNYDALEVRLTKKASEKWMGVLSYTYSKLWGNYAGLVNSDTWDGGSSTASGGGRLSPNVGRAFDEPFMQYDTTGKQAMGLLGTDRPHTLKAYGFYRLKWLGMETLLGGTQFLFSGTPLSSYANFSSAFAPMFIYGRDKYVNWHRDPTTGDFIQDSVVSKRTPKYSQTDLSLVHELKVSKTNEALRLGFEANITNLFNQRAAVSYSTLVIADGELVDPAAHVPSTSVSGVDYPTLTHYGFNFAQVLNGDNPGNLGPAVTNASYGKANLFQNGRAMRFKLKFTF